VGTTPVGVLDGTEVTVDQQQKIGAGQGPRSTANAISAGEDDLARHLSDLARDLQGEDSTDHTLAHVVQAAVELIPGAEEGSISVVIGRKEVSSQAPSGELPRQVDALQSETGQGPCLDAVYEHQTVLVTDMRTEGRWPEFARLASEAGAASMLSFQLYVEGDNLGALNLYARQPHAFDEESDHVGALFAAHAAVAFAGAQKQEQLTRALATRDLIGQAKGILMERYQISGDRAFQLLARLSQEANRKLRDVADQVVHGEVGHSDRPEDS
jgi:transcriptional regulator with GAF, ATPase, and Fis domain